MQPVKETTCQMTTTRRKRMTRLSGLIDGMVAPSVQKRGFVISRLVSEWPMIAGDMAQWSRPAQMNLSRSGSGTLKLAIASGFGPVALQMKGAIIERVNAAGYRAISEVVFVQTSHRRAAAHLSAPANPPLPSNEQRPHGLLMQSWKRSNHPSFAPRCGVLDRTTDGMAANR